MGRALFAPIAKLLELDFALDFFLVLLAPVIYSFTGGAGEFYKSVLAHRYVVNVGRTLTYFYKKRK